MKTLPQAAEAFSYPEEYGEHVHDSVEHLGELIGTSQGDELALVTFLRDELAKGYAAEASEGAYSPYSLARVAEGRLEMFSHGTKNWSVMVVRNGKVTPA